MFHTIEEAISDLIAGKVIIVCDDENRENGGDLAGLAELVTSEMINFMAKKGRGRIHKLKAYKLREEGYDT